MFEALCHGSGWYLKSVSAFKSLAWRIEHTLPEDARRYRALWSISNEGQPYPIVRAYTIKAKSQNRNLEPLHG